MLSLPHKLRNHASCRLRPSERIENGCDLGLGRVIQHFSIKTGSPRMQMTKMGVKFWYPEAVQTTFGPEQYHRPSGSQKRRNRQGANLKAPPPIDASAAARGDATTTTYDLSPVAPSSPCMIRRREERRPWPPQPFFALPFFSFLSVVLLSKFSFGGLLLYHTQRSGLSTRLRLLEPVNKENKENAGFLNF